MAPLQWLKSRLLAWQCTVDNKLQTLAVLFCFSLVPGGCVLELGV